MIDWGRVDTLRSDVGDDDFADVLGLFLEEVEEVMANLSSNMALVDYEPVLHFLKGSAMNLGFQALAELCRAGEQLSAQGETQSVDLDQIIECYRASKAVFQERVSMDSAA